MLHAYSWNVLPAVGSDTHVRTYHVCTYILHTLYYVASTWSLKLLCGWGASTCNLLYS